MPVCFLTSQRLGYSKLCLCHQGTQNKVRNTRDIRLQYNHSGPCIKKHLDPMSLRLICHYREAVYLVENTEEVWLYECIASIYERCDALKKAKKAEK
ncbi:BEN domain-containing protein 3 [Cricetulus griseus]|nr:BEN domain-containing protein 3 [Cricetulus griseus]